MFYIVTFRNMSTDEYEAHSYPTREAAEHAAKTEWFSVYPCQVMICWPY